jgi:hypothetical protein
MIGESIAKRAEKLQHVQWLQQRGVPWSAGSGVVGWSNVGDQKEDARKEERGYMGGQFRVLTTLPLVQLVLASTSTGTSTMSLHYTHV